MFPAISCDPRTRVPVPLGGVGVQDSRETEARPAVPGSTPGLIQQNFIFRISLPAFFLLPAWRMCRALGLKGVIVPSYLVGCVLVGRELSTGPTSPASATGGLAQAVPRDFPGIQGGIGAGQASGIGLSGPRLWRPPGCGDSGGSGTPGISPTGSSPGAPAPHHLHPELLPSPSDALGSFQPRLGCAAPDSASHYCVCTSGPIFIINRQSCAAALASCLPFPSSRCPSKKPVPAHAREL